MWYLMVMDPLRYFRHAIEATFLRFKQMASDFVIELKLEQFAVGWTMWWSST
jgi:hypothetical protein